MKYVARIEIDKMAHAIAEEMIPATDLANDAAVRSARTFALLLERTAALRNSEAGADLPIKFAESAIANARLAFDAACQARTYFIETRLSSLRVLTDIAGEDYGPRCPCRSQGQTSSPETAERPLALVA